MVENLDANLKEQAVIICKIEKAMRSKVKELIPTYKQMPVAQTVTTTQGEDSRSGCCRRGRHSFCTDERLRGTAQSREPP